MAPTAISVEDETPRVQTGTGKKPLKSTGSLDSYKHFDVTPVIGTEFPETNIVEDILSSDEKIRDLAIKSKTDMTLWRIQYTDAYSAKSPKEVSCSSEPRTTSQMIFRSSLCRDSVRIAATWRRRKC